MSEATCPPKRDRFREACELNCPHAKADCSKPSWVPQRMGHQLGSYT